MTTFVASVSIVCAFVGGAVLGYYFCWVRVFAPIVLHLDDWKKDVALQHIGATSWAYTQIFKALNDGATVNGVRALLHAEFERLERAGNERGAAVAENILTAWEPPP